MIGIGLMGHGIAGNLVRHGYPLTVLEHPGNQPLDALRGAGATTAQRASELAAAVDIVILCVTGSPQVEAILLDADGVLAGLKPGTIVIDCSTAIPTSTERLAARVTAAGGRFVDAAMTRTPREAESGRLNLLVGADPALFDEIRPLLACFAENITHAGPVGAGHRLKLLHNYVSLGFIALLAEAAACAERTGIAPDVLIDVLTKGGGGGMALQRLSPYLLERDPSGLQFAIANAAKDLGYYTTMAAESGAVHGIADSVRATLEQAMAEAPAGSVMPELVSVFARASG